MLALYCPFKAYSMKYLHVITYPEVVNRCQVEMDEMMNVIVWVRKILWRTVIDSQSHMVVKVTWAQLVDTSVPWATVLLWT